MRASRKIRWRVGLALALALTVAAAAHAQPWRGPVALGIEVVDGDENPVPGATVRLEYAEVEPNSGPPPLTTDAAGRAEVFGLAEGLWRAQIEREGFSPYLVVLRLDPKKKKVLITAGPLIDATAPPLEVSFVKTESRTAQSDASRKTEKKNKKREKKRKKDGERSGRISESEPERRPEPPPRPPVRTVPEEERRPTPPPQPPSQPSPRQPEPEPKPVEPKPVEPKPVEREPSEPEPSEAQPSEPEKPAPAEPVSAPESTPESTPEPEPEPPPVMPVEEPMEEAMEEAVEEAVEEPAEEAMEEPEPEPMEEPMEEPVAEPAPAPTRPPEPSPRREPDAPKPPRPSAEAAAAPAAASDVRTYQAGTCSDCRPGEAATSAMAAVGKGTGSGCPAGVLSAAEDALEALAAARTAGGYTGPLAIGGRIVALAPEAAHAAAQSTLGPYLQPDASCQLLAVVLDPSVKFSGYRYEARQGNRGGDCLAGQDCPIGGARWPDHPATRRTDNGTFVYAVFENRTDAERVAEMTVYFDPTP